MREARKGESEIALLPMLVDRTRNAIDAGANKGVYFYDKGALTHQFDVIAGDWVIHMTVKNDVDPKDRDVMKRTPRPRGSWSR